MNFKHVLDAYAIPPQNTNRPLHLISSTNPTIGTSRETTKVKREAIVQSILKALEDDDVRRRDVGEGVEAGVGVRVGVGNEEDEADEHVLSKKRKIEARLSRGISFIAHDDLLLRLDTHYEDLVDPTARFPSDAHKVWPYDEVRSKYYPDILEEACYNHLDSTLLLLLLLFFDTTHAILKRPDGHRRFDRARHTSNLAETKDGMTDYIGVGMRGGKRIQHPPCWEVKRNVVFVLAYFVILRQATEMMGGITLYTDGDQPVFRWPGGSAEWWFTENSARKSVEDVLKQVSRTSTRHVSFPV